MESIKNFTNAADMLAAWDSGNFEFTVEAADGHKLTSGFGKVHRLYLDAPALDYVYVYAGTGSAPIRYSYQLNTGVWRSTSGVRRLVARWKSGQPFAVGDRVKAAATEKPAPQAKAPPAGSVLPSDEAGIEAMVKRMLGQPKKAPPAAPAPQKPPFHKGLLIQASEKYMGLGFNDKQ